MDLKEAESFSSYEEGGIHNYDDYVDKSKEEPAAHTTEYYYQEYPYVKPTQAAFNKKQVERSKLFDQTKSAKEDDTSVINDEEPMRDASILISGFGMRNVDSFQKLIKMSREERKKWELRKLWRDQHASIDFKEEELKVPIPDSARTETTEASSSAGFRSSKTSSDFLSQTETTEKPVAITDKLKHLDYLLGLQEEMEEEPEPFEEFEQEQLEDDFKYSSSKPVREAQRYLRVHRIFECFQFIVAHLLGARAEDPIEFILNLLNRCLLYRSGLGNAPLLYEHKHIDKLFELMDRLQTGFIDMSQYATGMKTLGICSYNEDPEINDDALITKETFVEEAYEAELAIFEDLIKRRPEKNKPIYRKLPAVFDSVSIPSLNPPYFIPSDLIKFVKGKDTVADIEGE